MMWAPRSPWLPLPETFLLKRQMRGTSGAAPVLEVGGADVIDAADAPFFNELMGEGDCGHAAVGVPDKRFALLRLFGGVAHLPRVGERARERFFAGDVFAGLERGEGDVEVLIVWCGDVDQIDLGIGDGVFPVCRGVLPTPAGFECFQ